MTPLRITVDGTDTARFHDLLSVQCRKAPICKLARAMGNAAMAKRRDGIQAGGAK